MRFARTIMATLLALALTAGVAISGTAQVEPGTSELDIEGLEKAYGRTFNGDMMAMMEAPEEDLSGWFMLTVMVLEFDNEDNAGAGYEQLTGDASSSAAEEDVSLEEVELDLDVDYTAYQAVEEMDGISTNVLLVTAHDGDYVYAVSGITFGDDPVGTVESVFGDVQGADAGDDEEMFHDDGTSMGGLWEKFPTLESVQEQVPALTSASDTIYVPTTDSTPIN